MAYWYILFGATFQLVFVGSNSNNLNEPRGWYWGSYLSLLTISIPFLLYLFQQKPVTTYLYQQKEPVPEIVGGKINRLPLEKASRRFFLLTVYLYLLVEISNHFWEAAQIINLIGSFLFQYLLSQ